MPGPHSPVIPLRRRSSAGRLISALALTLLLLCGVVATPTPVADTTAWLILAVLVGLVVASLWLRRRDRLAYERSLEQEAAARAVAEDRLAIARDLHDAVSGSLGAITVRSAVAQRLDTRPEALLQALRDIEAASREATDALRGMLGVLRSGAVASAPVTKRTQADRADRTDGATAGDQATALPTAEPPPGPRLSAQQTPSPALSTVLEAAVAQARRNGVQAAVALGALNPERPLPAPLTEAAGAVIREALSNTARHAGPVRATIRVWEAGGQAGLGELRVLVADTGPAPGWQAQLGTGTGLRGLGERIEALGGSLRAGQHDHGAPGFAVEARLPLADSPARPRPAARRQRRAGGGQ